MNRVLLLVAATLALAGCAESEEASLVPPQDEGYNMVDPVKSPLVEEGELALGEWARSMQEEQPALLFGPPQTEPLFSMRCDTGEGLLLQRHGVIIGPGLNMMMVEIGGETRRLAVNPVGGTLPLLRAAVPRRGRADPGAGDRVGSDHGADRQFGAPRDATEPAA